MGKVYLQSVLDCFSRYAWGRLYTSKLPVTAIHVLNTDVLPHFEAHGAAIQTVLSDNGREFCGRADRHPYELFLQLEGIEHRTTKVRRPQSTKRPHQGRMMNGRTPEQMFVKGLPKVKKSAEEPLAEAA